MCGIAGRFHPLTLPAAPGWSTRASALLAHRGPDGEGHWRDARCELVHRRLALIDLSPTGRQPMANEDGSVQVIFNGEIYIYRQLTAELTGRGHSFRAEIDRQACYDFLGLGYVPEPATGFSNIQALPHGAVLTVDAGRQELKRYDQVEARPDVGRGMSDAVAAVSNGLVAAVEGQSVADVPVAALLSGGIDSSLVVAARRLATGEATSTFNVRFPDRTHDETPLAVIVSEQYGTRHHTIDLGDWAVTPDSILDLVRHFDQPFSDTSFIPMYWISRSVRDRGIICTLSGDGGDE